MKLIRSKDILGFNIIAYLIVGSISMACLLPFIMLVSGSFSDEGRIIREGFSILPKGFSLGSYELIFKNPETIYQAYGVTILVTLVSVSLSLFLISMTAYVMYRKDFVYRNKVSLFFYFTTLFNGGILPLYIIMVRYLHLKNNILALILPGLLNVFYLLVMRNFMNGSIPDALIEAAKIDGAGDFLIFIRIVFPLMKPALASIGLFIALGYWNDWYSAMLYIQKNKLYPLQYLLYQMLSAASWSTELTSEQTLTFNQVLPQETLKLAMTVVATGPIVFAYPFVQKYFVRGISIGAVKG